MKKSVSTSRVIFWVVFGSAAFLAGILLLGVMVGSFLGKQKGVFGLKTQSWEEYQRDAEAHGEIFSYVKLAPPPAPDDQNFAMTPLLQSIFTSPAQGQALAQRLSLVNPAKEDSTLLPEMGDWELGRRADLAKWVAYLDGADILTALKKYDAEMDEISAASRRPFARFPLPYQTFSVVDKSGRNNLGNPALTPLSHLSTMFELRALAELPAGQADCAAEDAITLFRLARSVQNEPLLISQINSSGWARQGLQVVWEGLAAHSWNDAQLARLQQELAALDFVRGTQRAMFGERVQIVAGIEEVPRNAFIDFVGVVPQLKINSDKLFNQYILPTVDASARRFNPAAVRAGEQFFNQQPRPLEILAHTQEMPARMLLGILSGSWYGTLVNFAHRQTEVDEAAVACALERHRLAHGGYPAKLDDLAPAFIAALPQDDIIGGPLHYGVGADGRYWLYAVGWNETDDHGTVIKDKDGDLDRKQGDWAWPFAAP